MSSGQLMRRCKHCQKSTLHIGPRTSHVLHVLLAIVTMGFWIPVWILVHLSNSTQLACTQCGKARGLFG